MKLFNYFRVAFFLILISATFVDSFIIEEASTTPQEPELGKPLELKCRSDSYFEFCIWRHKDRVCEFEWKRSHQAVVKQVRTVFLRNNCQSSFYSKLLDALKVKM